MNKHYNKQNLNKQRKQNSSSVSFNNANNNTKNKFKLKHPRHHIKEHHDLLVLVLGLVLIAGIYLLSSTDLLTGFMIDNLAGNHSNNNLTNSTITQIIENEFIELINSTIEISNDITNNLVNLTSELIPEINLSNALNEINISINNSDINISENINLTNLILNYSIENITNMNYTYENNLTNDNLTNENNLTNNGTNIEINITDQFNISEINIVENSNIIEFNDKINIKYGNRINFNKDAKIIISDLTNIEKEYINNLNNYLKEKKNENNKNEIERTKNNLNAEIKNKHLDIIFKNPTKNIEELKLNKIKLNNSNILELGIEDLDLKIMNSVNSYAIDPTKLYFNNGTLKAIAKGNELYKCKEWNFESQTCLSDWIKIMNLVPGEEYEIYINQYDPAFIEIIKGKVCDAAEQNPASNNYTEMCDYSDGSALLDDGTLETHDYDSATYAGVRIKSYNQSVTNCNNIISVRLCYEWWTTVAKTKNCVIAVDANNGTSYSTVSTTCPGTTQNPGVTCTDVTALETWTCENFYNVGGIKSLARTQIQRNPPAGRVENLVVDALYFNVTYNASNYNPIWSNNKTLVPSNSSYNPTKKYQFNITWTDDYAINKVFIEHNFSGILQNYSMSKSGNVYYYNITNIPTGNYRWKSYANDTYGLKNSTKIFYYYVKKAQSNITLKLNGTTLGNYTIYNNSYVNITGISNFPVNALLQIYKNGTLIQSGNSPLTNISLFDKVTVYNITLKFNGDKNYTSSAITKYVISQSRFETIPPIITITSPQNNKKTKNTLIYFNATTDESAYCRYSTNNTFIFTNGTLFQSTGTQQHYQQLIGLNEGNYKYYIKCIDTLGNLQNNSSMINFTVDRTPPTVVTNLRSTKKSFTWIYWNWTNPTTYDYNKSLIYLNGNLVASGNLYYYNATNLNPSTSYTLNAKTQDDIGNINQDYIANITTTRIDNRPVISEIKATPQVSYLAEPINITANVSDDYGISKVWFIVQGNIYYMNYSLGLYRYNHYYPPTLSSIYPYTVYANDTYGNSSKSSTFTVINADQTTYYEHLTTQIFNKTIYREIAATSTKSFPANSTTLGWNFTSDKNVGNGGLVLGPGDIKLSNGFKKGVKNNPNAIYINWKVYEVLSNNTEKLICSTPNGTSGKLITSKTNQVLSNYCVIFGEYYVKPASKIRVKIFGYNSLATAYNIVHSWDISQSGSSYIFEEISYGIVNATIKNPINNSEFMGNKTKFLLNCQIGCRNGSCLGINVTIQNKRNETSNWTKINSTTKPIKTNDTITNPIFIGGITTTANASIYLLGTSAINNTELRCIVVDKYQNTYTSKSVVVNILPEDKYPPILTNIQNNSITDNSAVISWTTDELSNSTVEYGTTQSFGSKKNSSNLVTTHSLLLNNLNPTTRYYYNVKSCDAYNNCNTSSTYYFNTTQVPDLTSPEIYNISSIPHVVNSTIKWRTNEASNSTVYYGTTIALGSSQGNSNMLINHTVEAINLIDNSLYYYKVKSCDASSNCNESSIYNFTTNIDQYPTIGTIGPANNSNQEQYSLITIYAIVNDDVKVSKVYANITISNGTKRVLNLVKVGNQYSNTFSDTSKSGIYNFTIVANDSKNQKRTKQGYFNVILDATPPTVTNLIPTANTNYYPYTNITIRTIVKDTNNLSFVKARVRYSNGTMINYTMNIGEYLNDSNTKLLLHLNNITPENNSYYLDSSENNNNGYCSGAQCPTLTTGKFGNARSFDGTDDYILVKNNISLNLSTAITIDAWVNINTYSNNKYIVSKSWTSNTTPFVTYSLGLGNSTNFEFKLSKSGTIYKCYSLNNSAKTGTWQHIAGVWNSTHMQIYINGKASGTPRALTGTIDTNTENITIGSFKYNNSYVFNGIIDEIRISNNARTDFSPNYYIYQLINAYQYGTHNITIFASDINNNINSNTKTYFKVISDIKLVYPENNSAIIERNPEFKWHSYISGYDKFDLQISNSSSFNGLAVNETNITKQLGNTTFKINKTLDVNKNYYWRVKAYNTTKSGIWSYTNKFTINKYLMIELLNNTKNFGYLGINATANTENESKFIIKNSGNSEVNITIKATQLFTGTNITNSYVYKIINITNSFIQGTTSYKQFNLTNTLIDIYNMNWKNNTNTAKMAIKIKVPDDEPKGFKTSTITITADG